MRNEWHCPIHISKIKKELSFERKLPVAIIKWPNYKKDHPCDL